MRRNRDYRSAARMWRTVIEQVPTSPRAHLNLGTALQEEGRAAETIAALRRAIELCEARAGCAGDWPISRGRALNQLGGLLVGIGRSAEGIAMLEEAARHGAEHGDRMLEGSAQYNLGRVYEAAGLAQEAFERRLAAARLLADEGLAGDLGDQAREAGRFEEAVACYRLALELEPGAENHHRLAAALGWLQRWEDAVLELRAAIALEPDRPEPYTDLGGALLFLGRPEDARVAFARALEIPPETSAEHTNLGTALFEAGRPEQALAEWRAALALDPASAETLRAAVGAALEKARKYDARTVELLERFRRELAADAEPAGAGSGG